MFYKTPSPILILERALSENVFHERPLSLQRPIWTGGLILYSISVNACYASGQEICGRERCKS